MAVNTAARLRPLQPDVSPHVLRDSAAMALLHAGVDLSVVAVCLGHESTQSVQTYLHTRHGPQRTWPVRPVRPAVTILAKLARPGDLPPFVPCSASSAAVWPTCC